MLRSGRTEGARNSSLQVRMSACVCCSGEGVRNCRPRKIYEVLRKPHNEDLNTVPAPKYPPCLLHPSIGASLRCGLCTAVALCLRLKPGALLMGGPPCSSFVWINAHTSGRSRSRPLGNCQREYICSSNRFLAHKDICLTAFRHSSMCNPAEAHHKVVPSPTSLRCAISV